ncbi:MAG: hypothetical protein AB1705_05330 [Verrucomicrobiota bacterium]
MGIGSWANHIDWQTPAGQMLQKLAAALPAGRRFSITVFGSAPIQITVEPSLLSADVDVFCDQEDFEKLVANGGLDKGHSDFYIQVSRPKRMGHKRRVLPEMSPAFSSSNAGRNRDWSMTYTPNHRSRKVV